MPPRWMMQREMRCVTFSRAVPPMSLEGILPSRIMKSWLRVGASSGFWIALSQPLWKAETMKRSLSHHASPPAHRCSWDYWHGWFNRSEEHTSELQSQSNLVCRLLLEKKNPRGEIRTSSE